MGVALVDDGSVVDIPVRSCELPACNEPIADSPGRPTRRYCSASHRIAARAARRAARQSERMTGHRPERLPDIPARGWGAFGFEGSPAPDAWPPWERTVHGHPVVGSRPWLRRAAVVIGALAIIVTGGYVAITSRAAVPPATAAVATAATADEWAVRAEQSVTSLEQQLVQIAQAEDAARCGGGEPAALRALQERKGLLQQRKATLWSQLETYRLLGRTRSDLARTEAELLAVEMELQAQPGRSAEQAAAVAALEQQRDLRVRQRDSQRHLVVSLEGSVASAVRTPLSE
jgi:hypothetical protein